MIHPLADVKSCNIGAGTTIWQFCVILEKAVIGKNCNINCQVFIENDVIIGDQVTIKPGVQIWDGLRIADHVFIGPNVTFTNDLVPRSKVYPEKFLKTIIDYGASIGANSTILSGITIGKKSFIGAGSVVTKSIQPYSVWYGNPARHCGYITDDNVILDLNLKDKSGYQHQLIDGKPVKI
jgi:UDP-2-acetamido-3-amino-2,3-dideoxy-glucuronate N-acetyltransferase